MRFSLVLAASIGGALLFTVTSCSSPPTGPAVKGTVVEKEYEAPKKTEQKVPYSTTSCGNVRDSKGKTQLRCKEVFKERKQLVTTRQECFELDIRTAEGDVVEVCDKAAYFVLDVDDHYDSTRDYHREEQ